MKTTFFNLNNWALMALFVLGACAQQIPLLDKTNKTTRSSVTETIYEKVCPAEQVILGTSAAKLSEFFGTSIVAEYVESLSFCIFIGSLGTKVDSGFAIELEQGSSNASDTDDGILYLEFGQSAAKRIKSSVVVDSTANTVAINLIYRDNYGLVQIKGNGTYGETVRATIRFYNFPSYADALTQAAAEAKAACLAAIAAKDGTAAQKCWGLQPALTQAWWLQPVTTGSTAEQQLIDAAEAALISANSRQLGQIDITADML
jgi:hypothetical protein